MENGDPVPFDYTYDYDLAGNLVVAAECWDESLAGKVFNVKLIGWNVEEGVEYGHGEGDVFRVSILEAEEVFGISNVPPEFETFPDKQEIKVGSVIPYQVTAKAIDSDGTIAGDAVVNLGEASKFVNAVVSGG